MSLSLRHTCPSRCPESQRLVRSTRATASTAARRQAAPARCPARQPLQSLGESLSRPARARRRPVRPAAAAPGNAEEEASEEDWGDFDEDFALMQSLAQGLQIDPERPTYHVLAAEGGWLNVSGPAKHLDPEVWLLCWLRLVTGISVYSDVASSACICIACSFWRDTILEASQLRGVACIPGAPVLCAVAALPSKLDVCDPSAGSERPDLPRRRLPPVSILPSAFE